MPTGFVAAEEPGQPLRFTVGPSGTEQGETLDQKLARRERSFRFICIGCIRGPGRALGNAPFDPIETLNAPGLSRAISDPPVEPAAEERAATD